tara:strand:+ start:272 stop:1126 length:855 start_codon:yes stop_codon:yes gene_type:complete
MSYRSIQTLKKHAKILRQTKQISHSQALDVIAQQEGFSSWSLLIKKRQKQPLTSLEQLWQQPGELSLLAAKMYVGKTTLMLNFALQAAKSGQRVVFLSTMLDEAALNMRLHAMNTLLPHALLQRPAQELTSDALSKMSTSISEFEGLSLLLCSCPQIRKEDLIERVDKAPTQTLFFFDYLQALGHFEQEVDMYESFMVELKKVVRRKQHSFFFLGQLQRPTEEQPTLSDLKGHPHVHRHFSLVLGLHRAFDSRRAGLEVLKSERLIEGCYPLEFDPSNGVFSEV